MQYVRLQVLLELRRDIKWLPFFLQNYAYKIFQRLSVFLVFSNNRPFFTLVYQIFFKIKA